MIEQERLAADLLSSTQRVAQQIDALVRPLPAQHRVVRPPAGGWSIDEILEHLCLANADYLPLMERALDTAVPARGRSRWRATGGWLLVRAMESSRRAAAPAAIVPEVAPRHHVLDELLSSLARLHSVITRADGFEWRRVHLVSPYARWLRLNLGDAALVVVRHTERHARQMARVAAAVR
ncbi:MAG: DinB family protein [Gemmatimonadetes bacterium]|nr:DinB family protein [Gemmatimonadota bacterium]